MGSPCIFETSQVQSCVGAWRGNNSNMKELTPLFGIQSPCHNSPSRIVRSRGNGFVSQNCIVCGASRFLSFREMPELRCDTCDSTLLRFRNDRKNYCYRCKECNDEFELASLVPHWSEHFDYDGLGLDTDSSAICTYTTPNLSELIAQGIRNRQM
jgi:DNA-directed RNA polymerase subunit RPC12/RpoP